MSNFNDQNDKSFDKKTMLAIVLMVVVVTVGVSIQNILFPQQPLPVEPTTAVAPTQSTPTQSAQTLTSAPAADTAEMPSVITEAGLPAVDAPDREEIFLLSTNLFEAVFTNKGGELVSLKLRKHKDEQGPVDMFLSGADGLDGLSLAIGGPGSAPLTDFMNASRPAPGVIEFNRTYFYRDSAGEIVSYVLRKRFEFKDGDYMFRVAIGFENSKPEALPIGDGEYAYTLLLGPQIGPRYDHLPKNADFRRFVTMENGKRKVVNPKNGRQTLANPLSWAAIAGKYFAFIAIPDQAQYAYTYTSTVLDGYPITTSLALSRPAINASAQADTFYFYAGPKSSRDLAKYDDPTANGFKRTSDNLEGVMEGGNMLGWLEALLKWSMNLFYSIVGNYGIAIIMVTLLVRLIMFPLTYKGSMSTVRMQELQPKIRELQAKYKGNPQKLNAEMAEFYKREGYNPLSGCLPLLIQFPIFIAMYALFNNHFDLRGASFIPGWIFDLSLPEAVATFPTINLIVWRVSAIRILPILYVGSQMLYGVFMQSPSSGGQNQGQMKMMMYGMPIIFFFVLYDMPSGLLVYWISSNLLTIVQQIFIKRITHKKTLAAPTATPQAKIIAGKGGKGIKKGRK